MKIARMQGRRHGFESGGTNHFASEKFFRFVPLTFGILGDKRIISVL
jgi:hypothetical protein